MVTLECVGGPMDGEQVVEHEPHARYFIIEKSSAENRNPKTEIPLNTTEGRVYGRYERAWIPKSNTDVWLWKGYRASR